VIILKIVANDTFNCLRQVLKTSCKMGLASSESIHVFESNFKIGIEFKLHKMSFNIFIEMDCNFHKINSVFSSLSLIVQSNVESKLE